jgi:hypothetical protein
MALERAGAGGSDTGGATGDFAAVSVAPAAGGVAVVVAPARFGKAVTCRGGEIARKIIGVSTMTSAVSKSARKVRLSMPRNA